MYEIISRAEGESQKFSFGHLVQFYLLVREYPLRDVQLTVNKVNVEFTAEVDSQGNWDWRQLMVSIKTKGRDEIIQEKVQIGYWKEQGFALRKFKVYRCRRRKSPKKKMARETLGKPGVCGVRTAPKGKYLKK